VKLVQTWQAALCNSCNDKLSADCTDQNRAHQTVAVSGDVGLVCFISLRTRFAENIRVPLATLFIFYLLRTGKLDWDTDSYRQDTTVVTFHTER